MSNVRFFRDWDDTGACLQCCGHGVVMTSCTASAHVPPVLVLPTASRVPWLCRALAASSAPESFNIKPDQVSYLLPKHFEERVIRAYCKAFDDPEKLKATQVCAGALPARTHAHARTHGPLAGVAAGAGGRVVTARLRPRPHGSLVCSRVRRRKHSVPSFASTSAQRRRLLRTSPACGARLTSAA